jgi:threonylcarbamoyladenosine tRNA methylthiotransferase MtaB
VECLHCLHSTGELRLAVRPLPLSLLALYNKKSMIPTFRILNFGCRASQADGAALKTQLLASGFAEAADGAPGDVAILNTCTVTARADAEVRQIARRIHRQEPECRILVTGCYAQRAPHEIAALDGVAWVVGNSHKHTIPEILANGLHDTGPAPAAVWVGEIPREFHFLPVSSDDRTRPTVKVQDGCNARCSFCVIPSVRGPSRSLPPGAVVAQIQALQQRGVHEVVLSGINLGGYGRDLTPKLTFLGLLEKILNETSMPRLRISSIEPMDVSYDLIRLVASEPRLADHFHVPLQSGCDHILRQMNRRYWTSHYAERIHAIRDALPNAAIGADVMVGFPGEAESDHEESCRFIEMLPFTYLHVFPYSARPSTPAATRQDRVNGRVASERGKDMRSLIRRKREWFLESQVGRDVSVLTLNEPNAPLCVGLSSNYLKVALSGSEVRPNVLATLHVTGVAQDGLVAQLPSGGLM